MPGHLASTLIKYAIASSVPFASLSLSRLPERSEPPPVVTEEPSVVEVEDPDTQFTKSPDGGYYATAAADGKPVRLLIDSGANITVISARDAREMGITPSRRSFSEHIVTAGGRVPIALVRVRRFAVANREFRDLRVAVAADGTTPSLIGTDVLSRFRRVTLGDGVMQLAS